MKWQSGWRNGFQEIERQQSGVPKEVGETNNTRNV